jgi:two-component system sensor histidine kinase FlrB
MLISIEDTGKGMNQGHQEQAFQPFYTTRQDGTGLGLSICRKHIEQHDGRVELESVEGRGTTVRIYLPIM